MGKNFQVRYYDDSDDEQAGRMIIEVSRLASVELITRIANFLERLRDDSNQGAG
mgnify:CR=1 FL=1